MRASYGLSAFALLLLASSASAHRGQGGGQGKHNGTSSSSGGVPSHPAHQVRVPFTLQASRVANTTSADCIAALNSTDAVAAACVATNVTSWASWRDPQCSDACGTAVSDYWTAANTACGSQVLLTFTPRNTSLPTVSVTAADLGPATLLERAMECTKDTSGSYCRFAKGFGAKFGKHVLARRQMGVSGALGLESSGLDTRGRGGKHGGHGGKGSREGAKGGFGNGIKGAFNETSCAECTTAALAAVAPLQAAYPSQTFFGLLSINSWDALTSEISTRCASIATRISSRAARPTGVGKHATFQPY